MKELNFILSFCREKLARQGEDSYCYAFCDTAGLLAVFDGCGGAGARTHSAYGEHTEAYMASRFAAGLVYDSFRGMYPQASGQFLPMLAPALQQRLQQWTPPQQVQIRGSLMRTLPTTAAIAVVQPDRNDLVLKVLWAGDSRVYLLTQEGLCQLTVDDTGVKDAFDSFYDDGVLKNLICADREFTLHCRELRVAKPCVLLTATDGCFGYVASPMEFEALLLEALAQADSPQQWQQALEKAVAAVAGDDACLCLAAFGFETMESMKQIFAARYAVLKGGWLNALGQIPVEDRVARTRLWSSYKNSYCRYGKEGL